MNSTSTTRPPADPAEAPASTRDRSPWTTVLAVALGLAVGWWIVFIAAPLVALAVVGWVFEYFSGEHAI